MTDDQDSVDARASAERLWGGSEPTRIEILDAETRFLEEDILAAFTTFDGDAEKIQAYVENYIVQPHTLDMILSNKGTETIPIITLVGALYRRIAALKVDYESYSRLAHTEMTERHQERKQLKRQNRTNASGPRDEETYSKVVRIGNSLKASLSNREIVQATHERMKGELSLATIRRYLQQGGVLISKTRVKGAHPVNP
ncbi:hypothetical protein D0849_08220 [Bordetella avium]|uniref:hypothetical protein n=1 Tax=Bordetella avium TaxID=521 RepID=UPI000E683C4D|nr:hypothetical protein [Bordetella avium]RIQ20019.1 hypothetical protein D0850_02235 [Bordetella avium]RIQ34599.1 hypothetical protein D0849_08220 [Bordetella avium]